MDFIDLTQFDTKLTADVCEWQPFPFSNSSSKLACATYFLNKETNQRSGCLYLISYDSIKNELNQIQKINYESSGILDMKWISDNEIMTLDSNQNIELFKYEDGSLTSKASKSFLNEENNSVATVGLTFDYCSSNESKIVTGNSKGTLNVIDAKNMLLNAQFNAHEFEIWSVYMCRHDNNIVYSGADDCLLKMWDLRDTERAKLKCSLFDGGVTQIQGPYYYSSNGGSLIKNFNENNLLCSSYDEQIYVLDKRNLKNFIKKSKKLGGGVWKMRVNEDNLILCACMHTGVHVVDLKDLESKLYYDKHGLNNLAYGCDWLKTRDSKEYLTATCSFYNHELRVWKLKY